MDSELVVGHGVLLADDFLTKRVDSSGLRELALNGALVVRVARPCPGFFVSFADGWIGAKSCQIGPDFPRKSKAFQRAFRDFAEHLTSQNTDVVISPSAYVVEGRILKRPMPEKKKAQPNKKKKGVIAELFGSDEESDEHSEQKAKTAQKSPSGRPAVHKTSRSTGKSSKIPLAQLLKQMQAQSRRANQLRSASQSRPSYM